MGYFDPKDGRRRSDPLMSLDRAPACAPDWQLYRMILAQDVAPHTDIRKGLNCGHYMKVRLAIVPWDKNPLVDPTAVRGGVANPNIEVFVWSEGAQRFLSFDTAITATGSGAGVAYTVDVENANGAILFVALTNVIASGAIAVSAQAYEMDHTL